MQYARYTPRYLLSITQIRRAVKFWRCYRCGRAFVHARFLVAHLIDVHNEAAPLCTP